MFTPGYTVSLVFLMLCSRTFYRCTTLFRKCMWKHRWERSLFLLHSLSLSLSLFLSHSTSHFPSLTLSLPPSLACYFRWMDKRTEKFIYSPSRFQTVLNVRFNFCKTKLLIGGHRNKNQLLLTLLICSESDFESHYPWRGNQVFENV